MCRLQKDQVKISKNWWNKFKNSNCASGQMLNREKMSKYIFMKK